MSLEASVDKLIQWKKNPVQFVEENFGVTPDFWQREALMALPHNRRMAFIACKGPGKTAFLAWAVWWFLACFINPKVICTSISGDNLRDGLWTELALWRAKSPFLMDQFEWLKTRVELKASPETWYATARNWPKSADPGQQANTMAGLHADNIMFLLDEVGGIPDAVMAAAEAALANDSGSNPDKCAKILMAGNPTHLAGPLYRAATTERHMWWVKEITADPDAADRTPRVSVQWAREQIEKYGRDNPWVIVNVFGRFPPSSLNTLLGVDEVNDAMKRGYDEEDFAWAQKRLGVDVARFGDDRTVIFPRQGLVAHQPVTMRNARTPEIAARVAQGIIKWRSEMEFVDGTGGFGAGVVDNLRTAGYEPQEIHFSGKPSDPHYYNKRAEMWFALAEWVKRGGALPKIPELVKELTEPQYTLKDGKFLMESKDQIKARLGFSPDLADALCLTFAYPDMPGDNSPQGRKRRYEEEQHANGDWDPFSDDRVA